MKADDVRHLCGFCDEDGIVTSPMTGARGRCRHPSLAYEGHEPERIRWVEDHLGDDPPCVGQWCCGCEQHPISKPWGWNYQEWERHYAVCTARSVLSQ